MDRLDAYTYAASIYEEIRLLFIELGLTVDITEYINTSRTTYENAINNLTPDKISKGVLLYPLGDFNYKTTQINSIFINYLNALDVAQQAVNYNIGGVRQNIYFQINILAKNYKDAEYIANLIHAKFYRHSGHKTYDLETNQFSTDYFYSVSDFGVEANKIGKADLEHVVEYIIAIGLHQVPIIFSYTQAEIEYGIFQKLNTVLKIADNNYSLETEYEYNVGDEVTHTDISLNQYFNIVKAGYTYNVEDKPLIWLGGYYNTFKGDTFEVSGTGDIFAGDAIDYAAVTEIGQLGSKNLTTDFNVNFLGKFKNLEELYIDNNQISILDISLNEKLSIVYFNNNQISNFNTSSNPLLTYVIGYNNNLETVDFTNNPLLTNIQLYNNKLTALNTLSNPLLKELIVLMNSITSFDFSNNTLLENVRLQGNNFHSLDISMLSNLKYLYMSVANITTLDTSNNPELLELSIPFCNINSLSFLNNTKLVYFRGNDNKLTNLVNSQILIDLDAHGKSNGFFSSSIYGGGTLTAAGLTAKANLQAKGWTILGL